MSEHSKATQATEESPTHGLPEPPFPLVTPLARKLWELRRR